MMKNRVAAIGDFDGVHRGHQEILQQLVAWAAELDAEPMVISFIANTKGRRVITGAEMKEYYIRQCGVEQVIFLPFDQWKDVPADAFAEEFLKKEHAVVGVLSGGELHFGKDRSGNEFTLLSHGIAVKKANDRMMGEHKISSSSIRDWLERGELAKAEEALGHPFSLMGKVCHGKGLAHTFGLPTVNIPLPADQLLPPYGVYAAWAEGCGKRWPAVANIGVRPTVEQTDVPNLEAHLLEDAEDLYDQTLRIEIKAFLRGEEKFSDPDALFLQIKMDGEKSKEVLRSE